MNPLQLRAKAKQNRIPRKDSFWDDKKKNFTLAVVSSFVLIQILFLGVMSYLYGSVYQATNRTSGLNVLMVDFDGDVIGESLRIAASSLQSSNFPKIIEKSTSDFPGEQDVVDAVYHADYWAAVFTTAGASQRLLTAISGAATGPLYNASNSIIYVFNEARYPTVEAGFVDGNMQKLIAASRVAYSNINGTFALQTIDTNSSTAKQALFNPIVASSINIKPTPQQTKTLYNTISMVMPIIMQFFFLMAVNGVSGHFSIYSHLPLRENGLIRVVLSCVYTFIGALCTAGYQHAFEENNWLTAGQFVLVWMTFWLYMHINFVVIDCATAFIPLSFISFFFFSWVILNVTSVIFPFELSPGFYRWGYALPAHEAYQVLVTIWSGGAANNLYRALPILFAWEVFLTPIWILALYYRCGNAAKEYEQNEEAMQKKYGNPESDIAVADKVTGDHDLERQQTSATTNKTSENLSFESQSPNVGNGYFPRTPVPFQDTLERITSSSRTTEQRQ